MATPDGSISVASGDIEIQAKNLGDLKNETELALNMTAKQIKSLFESGAFTGMSGESFQQKFDEWHLSAGKTVSLLEEFASYMTKTSSAFQEVDAAYTLK